MSLQFVTNFGFTTAAEALAKLYDTLVLAGWEPIQNTATQIRLRGQSFSDSCWLQASTISRGGGKSALVLRGSLDDTFTTLSPALPTAITQSADNTEKTKLDLRFTDGGANLLSVTASEDAFCVAVRDSAESMLYTSAWRFGFYDRPKPAIDPTGWGLGPLYTGTPHNWVARRWLDNSAWFELSASYAGTATDGGTTAFAYNVNAFKANAISGSSHAIKGFMNPFSQSCLATFATNSPTTNVQQICGNFYIGNSIGTNSGIKPFPLWLQEFGQAGIADGTTITSKNQQPLPIAFRGFVKYAATGFGHLPGNTVVSVDGNSYLVLGLGTTIAMLVG